MCKLKSSWVLAFDSDLPTYGMNFGRAKVNAVLYFRVVDAERAINNVENSMAATGQLAQTTLRSVLGQHELDELLAERERLNSDIQDILDQQTDQPLKQRARWPKNLAQCNSDTCRH